MMGTRAAEDRGFFWALIGGALVALAIVMIAAFKYGFLVGAIGAVAGIAALLLMPNFRLTFLGLVCLIPHLGEVDRGGILPILFLIPFWLCVASWVFNAFFQPKEIFLEPRYTFLYALFFLAAILSVWLGLSPSLIPDWLLVSDLAYHRFQEALFASLISMLAMSACKTIDDIKRLCWVAVIVAIPYAITLFFFGAEIEPDGSIPRRKGFYLDAHPGAFHMQFSIWLGIALIRTTTSWGWKRIFLIAACFLFLSTHMQTNARMIQATVPTMVLVALVLEGKARWAFVTCIGLGVAFFLLLPVMPQNLRSNFLTIMAAASGGVDPNMVQMQEGVVNLRTFAVRYEHIRWGLEVWSEHPWLGVGLGKHMWISNLPEAPAIHNFYVGILAEMGIIGFTLLTSLVLLTLVVGLRFLHRMLRAGEKLLAYFTESLLVIMLSAMMVFMTSMGNAQGERYIWFSMGMIMSLPALYARCRKPRIEKR